jgi:outer membrane protein assembly factor BamB
MTTENIHQRFLPGESARRLSAASLPRGLPAWFLLLGLVACSSSQEPRRFAIGIAAVGQDQAVLITWPKAGQGARFVELVPAQGRPLWSRAFSDLTVPNTLGNTGVAATGDRIILYGERAGKIVVLGLDRATGKTVWETPVGNAGNTRMGPMLLVDQGRVLALHPDNPWTRDIVTALSATDGKLLWSRTDLPGTGVLSLTIVGPGRLVGSTLGAPAFLLDGATGQVIRTLPFNRPGCLTQLGTVGVDGPMITLIPAGDPAPEKMIRLEAGLRAQTEPCGQRDGDLVLGAYAQDGSEHFLVRLDPATGALRWRLGLGKDLHFPGRAIGDRMLPRVLPVQTVGRGPGGGALQHQLVFVDLDAGRITGTSPLAEHYLTPVLHGGRAFFKSQVGDRLFFPDPGTGALTRVLRLDGVSVQDLAADDLGHDKLWFFGSAWARRADLPRAVLDLTTGAVLTHGELHAVDVTSEGWPLHTRDFGVSGRPPLLSPAACGNSSPDAPQ